MAVDLKFQATGDLICSELTLNQQGDPRLERVGFAVVEGVRLGVNLGGKLYAWYKKNKDSLPKDLRLRGYPRFDHATGKISHFHVISIFTDLEPEQGGIDGFIIRGVVVKTMGTKTVLEIRRNVAPPKGKPILKRNKPAAKKAKQAKKKMRPSDAPFWVFVDSFSLSGRAVTPQFMSVTAKVKRSGDELVLSARVARVVISAYPRFTPEVKTKNGKGRSKGKQRGGQECHAPANNRKSPLRTGRSNRA